MILVLATDLFFASRIAEVGKTLDRPVKTARSADQLLALAAEVRPELVFVDLHLRDLDSIAALKQLRAGLLGVRIVCFFPHVDDELGESARAAGADLVLTRGQVSKQLPGLIGATAG
jgi:DNA-binding NarL/FixJ family response regulator